MFHSMENMEMLEESDPALNSNWLIYQKWNTPQRTRINKVIHSFNQNNLIFWYGSEIKRGELNKLN